MLVKRNRIVIKIGSNCLGKKIQEGIGEFNFNLVKKIASDIAMLKIELGISSAIVGSGSISAGVALLGYEAMPRNKLIRQRCSGIGQGHLLDLYQEGFRNCGFLSQYLVMIRDFHNLKTRRNIVESIEDDWKNGIIPFFNYNDKIEPEIVIRKSGQVMKRFPDNDTLGARVAGLAGAYTLLILTKDVNGVLDKKKEVIKEIKGLKEIDICKSLDDGHGRFGTGGLETKLEAAKIMVKNGGVCIIGNVFESIPDLLNGKALRTIICGERRMVKIQRP